MRSAKDWLKAEPGALWVPRPTRRTILSGAVGGAALLLGCGKENGVAGGSGGNGGDGSGGASAGGSGGINTTRSDGSVAFDASAAPPDLACTTRDQQIVGPYPAAGVQLDRSDIRSDPANGNLVKPGVPLRVVIRVGSKTGADCLPMKGAVVNAWQCDAAGQYASYASLGTANNQFLRGYQVTDGSGVVEFQTIYPGSYAGRAVHFHFSVRMSPSIAFPDGAFVGQLYFPDAITDQVLMQAPYSSANRVLNAQDAFYKDDMLGAVSPVGDGWLAQLELGV